MLSYLQKMLIFGDFSKKCFKKYRIQKVFVAFLKVFKLLSMCAKFKVNK